MYSIRPRLLLPAMVGLASRCMMSTSSSSSRARAILPVVDISPFVAASNSPSSKKGKKRVCEAIRKACTVSGFFYITGHGVEDKVVKSVFSAMREFFARPIADKMSLHVSRQEGFRGYSGMFEQGNYGVDNTDRRIAEAAVVENQLDAKEVYHIGEVLSKDHKHYHPTLFAANVWPSVGSGLDLERAAIAHWRAMMALSDSIFAMFAHALELKEDHFSELTAEGMNSMNMIHYPPLPASEPNRARNQLGIGAHTDFECFTLLAQDGDVAGLEILDPQCGEWRRVEPVEGALLVNVGDLMARWSNDTFRSTVHRAISHEDATRNAIAFFRCCDYATVLDNLTDGASKYKPVIAGEHMLERIERANEPNAEAVAN